MILKEKRSSIPDFVRPFLWSYNIDKIDIERNKKRIIINVLNLGTKRAVDWIFKTYNREEIKRVVENSLMGDWGKKSINLWSLVFDINIDKIKKTRISV